MVVGSSLPPHASLLMPHSGSTGSVVHLCVGKKQSVKADLAIYGYVLGVSGQWVSVAIIMLSYKLDFSFCDNSVGFCKLNHTI